jgi:hypothetical protein
MMQITFFSMAEYGSGLWCCKIIRKELFSKNMGHLKSGKAQTAAKQSVQSGHEGHMKKAKIAIGTHIIR